MADKNLKARIVHKHDTEANWQKATGFIPKMGELIVYDIDSTYGYERFKIGDGATNVNSLPFADAHKVDQTYFQEMVGDVAVSTQIDNAISAIPQADWNQNDTTAADYIENRPFYESITDYTWDGNTEGRDTYSGYVKISDDTPTPETLLNGAVLYDGSNKMYDITAISCMYNDTVFIDTQSGTFQIFYSTSCTIPASGSSFTVPSTGIYYYNSEYTVSRKLQVPVAVKIDKKFIPDSLASIPTEIETINTTLSSKMNSNDPVGTGSFSMGRKADTTIGNCSHAEGTDVTASGSYSHAEGASTTASQDYSHAEGYYTTASGSCSHAEGQVTTASGIASHAEGDNTTASGKYSHAEGSSAVASGHSSHAEGISTTALCDSSHAEGRDTTAGQMGFKVTACEKLTNTTGTYTLSSITGLEVNQYYSVHLSSSKENCGKITAIDTTSKKITVDGYPDIALSSSSSSTANYITIVNEPTLGDILVSGNYSHAEGLKTTALGVASHAEGRGTTASGGLSHAEGQSTTASGSRSHAEGYRTTASGNYSHAEGSGTNASGTGAHAEGGETIAAGNNQHVEGRYNIEDTSNKYAHIIGNGTSDTKRSNAHTLDWSGNAWFAGEVKVGGTSQDDASAKTFATIETAAKLFTYKGYIRDKQELETSVTNPSIGDSYTLSDGTVMYWNGSSWVSAPTDVVFSNVTLAPGGYLTFPNTGTGGVCIYEKSTSDTEPILAFYGAAGDETVSLSNVKVPYLDTQINNIYGAKIKKWEATD